MWALGQSQRLHLLGNNGLSATGPAAFLEHWNGQDWRLTTGAAPTIYDGRPAIAATADRLCMDAGHLLLRQLHHPVDRRNLGIRKTSPGQALAQWNSTGLAAADHAVMLIPRGVEVGLPHTVAGRPAPCASASGAGEEVTGLEARVDVYRTGTE